MTEGKAPVFSRLHAHVPLSLLARKMDLFSLKKVHPEIYCNYKDLEKFDPAELVRLSDRLKDQHRDVTVHGPFFDLSPGAVDPAFRDLTVRRLRRAVDCARIFEAKTIVFHPGYDPVRFAEHRDLWLRNSLKSWKAVHRHGRGMAGTFFLVENIFETRPDTIADLLAGLPTPPFGFCLDVGHFQLFSEVPLKAWLDSLGPYLREVHLHDNSGDADSHLPPGSGTFDFEGLFGLIPNLAQDIIGTIEAHREADLLQSIDYLRHHGAVE